jgi:hypothetical protein
MNNERFILLRFDRTPKNTNKSHKPYAKKIILINIDPRKIKFISLDSSHQDDSNEPKMIKIQSLDHLKTGVCRSRNFENTPEISKILRIFKANLNVTYISIFRGPGSTYSINFKLTFFITLINKN